MKNRCIALILSLALSCAALVGLGAYEKYRILAPLDLGEGRDIASLPFQMASDDVLRTEIALALEELEAGGDTPDTDGRPQDQAGGDRKPAQTTTRPNDPTKPGSNVTIVDIMVDEEDYPYSPGGGETADNGQTDTGASDQDTPGGDRQPGGDDDTGEDYGTGEDQNGADGGQTGSGYVSTGLAVEDSWFDDALFIGDSRTVGLRDYARLGQADYFCTVGMTVFNALKETAADKNFSSETLEKLLESKKYGKIFICLGINECGYAHSSIMKQYRNLISVVRGLQPEAIVILQSIMTTGRAKAASAAHFAPDNLNAINELIKAESDGESVFFVDVNQRFADAEGYLPDDLSWDGCHLYAKYYPDWVAWLKEAVYPIA